MPVIYAHKQQAITVACFWARFPAQLAKGCRPAGTTKPRTLLSLAANWPVVPLIVGVGTAAAAARAFVIVVAHLIPVVVVIVVVVLFADGQQHRNFCYCC